MAIFATKKDDQKTGSEQENVLKLVKNDSAPDSAAASAKEAKTKSAAKSKEDTGDAYRVLIKPILSEKSFKGAAIGKFIFKVSPTANKISIRNAIERVYDVHVVRVNIIRTMGKTRNFGRISGKTSDWKKAIVTLKKGESISEVAAT